MRGCSGEGLTGIREKSAMQFAGVARAGFVRAMVVFFAYVRAKSCLLTIFTMYLVLF